MKSDPKDVSLEPPTREQELQVNEALVRLVEAIRKEKFDEYHPRKCMLLGKSCWKCICYTSMKTEPDLVQWILSMETPEQAWLEAHRADWMLSLLGVFSKRESRERRTSIEVAWECQKESFGLIEGTFRFEATRILSGVTHWYTSSDKKMDSALGKAAHRIWTFSGSNVVPLLASTAFLHFVRACGSDDGVSFDLSASAWVAASCMKEKDNPNMDLESAMVVRLRHLRMFADRIREKYPSLPFAIPIYET